MGNINKFTLKSFALNGQAMLIVGYRWWTKMFECRNMKTGTLHELSAEDLLRYKADGWVVHGCYYSDTGISVRQDNKIASIDIEVFAPVRFAQDTSDLGGYEYKVSNLGNVLGRHKGTEKWFGLRHHDTDSGPVVGLILDNDMEDIEFYVAEIVLNAFIAKPGDSATIGSDMHEVGAKSALWSDNNSTVTDSTITDSLTAITCYNSSGELIEVFDSIDSAAASGITSRDFIVSCCEKKGSVRSRGSCYVWRYLKDDELLSYTGIWSRRKAYPGSMTRQYDVYGNLVGEWCTRKQASDKLGIDAIDIAVSAGSKKLSDWAGGFMWQSVADDKLFELSVEERHSELFKKSIRQYSTDGELVFDHPSVSYAAFASGITQNVIANSCSSKSYAGGYFWFSCRDDELIDRSVEERVKLLGIRKIRQYAQDGTIVGEYVCAEEAVEKTKVRKYPLLRACERDKGYLTTGGFFWRYADDDELYDLCIDSRERKFKKLKEKTKSECPAPSCYHPFINVEVERQKAIQASQSYVGANEELHKWYELVRSQPVTDDSVERWVPAPLVNYKRKDGSWMYEVSDKGGVRRSSFLLYSGEHRDSHLLMQRTYKSGKKVVTLYDPNGDTHRVDVARLVAIAFVRNPDNEKNIIHKDGDIGNNDWRNLGWGSYETVIPHQDEEDLETVTEVVAIAVRQYSLSLKLLAEYNSISEAADAVGASTTDIRRACKDKSCVRAGFYFRLVDSDELKDFEFPSVDMSKEIWKQVSLVMAESGGPGSYAVYEISNYGRLRRPSRISSYGVEYKERMLSLVTSSSGSKKFSFRDSDGSRVSVFLDLLVATEFIPNPNNYERILHLDGDMSNDRADNLVWAEVGTKRTMRRMSVKVHQYTTSGEYVAEFDTIVDAAKSVNGEPSVIQRVCERRFSSKTAYDFVWRYSNDDEFEKGKSGVVPDLGGTNRAVRKYSLDGKFIEEFDSVKSAAESDGCSSSSISAVCRGVIVTAGHFMWRYVDEDDLAKAAISADDILKERSKDYKTPVRKPNPDCAVRQYAPDGSFVKIHRSAYQAAKEVGTDKSNILLSCNRKTKGAKGFVWRRVKDDDLFNLSVAQRADMFARCNVRAKRRGVHVRKYSLDHKLLEEFDSITDAANSIGVKLDLILACCIRKSKTSCGFIWRYVDDDEFSSGV